MVAKLTELKETMEGATKQATNQHVQYQVRIEELKEKLENNTDEINQMISKQKSLESSLKSIETNQQLQFELLQKIAENKKWIYHEVNSSGKKLLH